MPQLPKLRQKLQEPSKRFMSFMSQWQFLCLSLGSRPLLCLVLLEIHAGQVTGQSSWYQAARVLSLCIQRTSSKTSTALEFRLQVLPSKARDSADSLGGFRRFALGIGPGLRLPRPYLDIGCWRSMRPVQPMILDPRDPTKAEPHMPSKSYLC